MDFSEQSRPLRCHLYAGALFFGFYMIWALILSQTESWSGMQAGAGLIAVPLVAGSELMARSRYAKFFAVPVMLVGALFFALPLLFIASRVLRSDRFSAAQIGTWFAGVIAVLLFAYVVAWAWAGWRLQQKGPVLPPRADQVFFALVVAAVVAGLAIFFTHVRFGRPNLRGGRRPAVERLLKEPLTRSLLSVAIKIHT